MTYNTIFICCKYQNFRVVIITIKRFVQSYIFIRFPGKVKIQLKLSYVPFHIFHFYLIIQQIAFYEIKEKQRHMHSNYFQDICLDARFGNKFALQGIIFYYKPCKLYSTYTHTHTPFSLCMQEYITKTQISHLPIALQVLYVTRNGLLNWVIKLKYTRSRPN